jgi:phosphoenolpyruvate carboxylase
MSRPVLTAHPTEVQRKSILDAERAIASCWPSATIKRAAHAKDALTPRELADNEALMRARVMQLWQTRLLRFTKLTVADEIENALSYYEATFLREIPKLYAELDALLLGHQPVASFPAHGPVDRRRPRRQPQRQRRHAGIRAARQAEVALRHYLTEVHCWAASCRCRPCWSDVSPEMQALAERSPDTNAAPPGRALPPRADRHVRAPGRHAART